MNHSQESLLALAAGVLTLIYMLVVMVSLMLRQWREQREIRRHSRSMLDDYLRAPAFPPTPEIGMQFYDTSTGRVYEWVGEFWAQISQETGITVERQGVSASARNCINCGAPADAPTCSHCGTRQ